MAHIELERQFASFGCSHIRKEHTDAIQSFKAKNKSGYGLEVYLKDWALDEEKDNLARTYLIWDTSTWELAGFFSLKAGTVSRNERRSIFSRNFDAEPGIELANFALNGAYTEKHREYKGLGLAFFLNLIMPIIYEAAQIIGVDMVYIYALPFEKLMRTYQNDYGFSRLSKRAEKAMHRRLKPNYDRDCIFMYMMI